MASGAGRYRSGAFSLTTPRKEYAVLKNCRFGIALTLALFTAVHAEQTIQFGQTLAVGFCNGSVDSVSFSADAGDRVVLFGTDYQDLGGACSPGCCCFDQCMELWNESGVRLGQSCTGVQGNCCGCASRLRATYALGNTGLYRILSHDQNFHGGGYFGVFIQRTSDPLDPTTASGLPDTLFANESRLGFIANGGEVDTYVFTGAAGQHATVTMTAGSIGAVIPWLELYNPTGEVVAISGTGSIDYVLLDSGRFTVLAYSVYGEMGTYDVRLTLTTTAVEPSTWGRVKSTYR
jgi:hypothetical protein